MHDERLLEEKNKVTRLKPLITRVTTKNIATARDDGQVFIE